MRPSLKKHVLAILREKTGGYNQNAFAELLGCSLSTVQSIESGRLGLSDKLAEKAEFETGVSRDWLSLNNKKAPIVDRWGEPYTVQTFERVQAENKRPKIETSDLFLATSTPVLVLQKTAALVAAVAENQGNISLLAFKLDRAFDVLFRELGVKWGDPSNSLTCQLLDEVKPEIVDGMVVVKRTCNRILEEFEKRITATLATTKDKSRSRASARFVGPDGMVNTKPTLKQ